MKTIFRYIIIIAVGLGMVILSNLVSYLTANKTLLPFFFTLTLCGVMSLYLILSFNQYKLYRTLQKLYSKGKITEQEFVERNGYYSGIVTVESGKIKMRFYDKVLLVSKSIFTVVIFGIVFYVLITHIIKGRHDDYIKLLLHFSFWISLIIVALFLQAIIRESTLQKQTWRKITDEWKIWTGVPAIAVGGFGFIGTNQNISNRLFKITTDSPYVDLRFLISVYLICIFLTGFANLCILIGRAKTDNVDSQLPENWFMPAFLFTWFANLGIYALFLEGLFLTFHAHLTS